MTEINPLRCVECTVFWQPEHADELVFATRGFICRDRRACLERQRRTHEFDQLLRISNYQATFNERR